ncbi:MAG: amino acid transporter substrate-binding protein, partial [Rhodoferax sp.]|nr:amino acid transporter substrate-binding protein [Rhodoferax sp.]
MRLPFSWLGVFGAGVACLATALPAQADVLEKIRSTGSITLAHRDASIPFSYLDQDKHAIGYSIDLCLKVVDAIRRDLKLDRLEVKYLQVTPASRIAAITEGQAQMECGSTTNTADRRKTVDFTIAHFISSSRLLVRSDAKISAIDQLATRTVVSTKGTTSLTMLRRVSD